MVSRPTSEIPGLGLAIETSRLGARARAKIEVSERLRTSALELFTERSFDSVTVEDIARRAGYTSRTFFRYFPTKETVITDIIEQMNRRLVEMIRSSSEHQLSHLLLPVLRQWFREFDPVLALVRSLLDASESLHVGLDTRQLHWEAEIADALAVAVPGRPAEGYRLWGVIVYGLLRVIDDTIRTENVPMEDAISDGFDALTAEFKAF
jgi:AcrR family transcriptional regulator